MRKWDIRILEDQNIKIVRSRNYKRLSLSVAANGRIRVSAPSFISMRHINRFVAQYIDQVKIDYEKHSRDRITEILENDLVTMPFLDQQKTFVTIFNSNKRPGFNSTGQNTYEIVISEDKQKQQIEVWRDSVKSFYRQEARAFFLSRADHYCERLGTKYKLIRIGDQTSRWGSCSGRGTLSYNLRLMLAPFFVADYVALHEVAHLLEGNHSKKFWDLMDRYNPDVRSAKKWLKENGKELWKYF